MVGAVPPSSSEFDWEDSEHPDGTGRVSATMEGSYMSYTEVCYYMYVIMYVYIYTHHIYIYITSHIYI